MNRAFSTILFAILLVSTASAFSVYGNFSVKTDCIAPASATWEIQNDSAQQAISITAKGNYAAWVNANSKWVSSQPLELEMSPDEPKKVYAFIKPDCGIKSGRYIIEIEFSGNNTITKTLTVDVAQTTSIDFNISPSTLKTGQCSSKDFNLSFKNSGKTSEAISLSLNGLQYGWFDFNQTHFVLDKNSTKSIPLKISVPCNAETKNYRAAINASIAGTGISIEKKAVVAVENSGNLSISIPDISYCIENGTKAKATIQNNGDFNELITISISGKNLSIDKNTLSIKPKESNEITITAKKSDSGIKSDYNLSVFSKTFNQNISKKAELNGSNCFEAKIYSSNIPKKACIEGKTSILFTISNNGSKKANFFAKIKQANSNPEDLNAELEAGGKKQLEFDFDFSREKTGEKQFYLEISNPFFSMKKAYSIGLENCFEFSIDSNAFKKEIEINAGESASEKIIVSNNGTKKQTVGISTKGIEWVYVKPAQIEIDSGKKAEVFAYIAPPKDAESKNYTATISFNSSDFSREKTMRIKVSETIDLEKAMPKAKITGKILKIETKNGKKNVLAVIKIENIGLVPFKIMAITSPKYDANFEFGQNKTEDVVAATTAGGGDDNVDIAGVVIAAVNSGKDENSIDLNALIALDSNANAEKILLPLEIKTENSEIKAVIELKQEQASSISALVILGNWKILFVLGAIIAVILIAIMLVGKGKKKSVEETKENTKLSTDHRGKALYSIWQEQQNEKPQQKINTLDQIAREIKEIETFSKKENISKKTRPKEKLFSKKG